MAQLATRLGGQSLEPSGSPTPERELPSRAIPEPTGSLIPEQEPTQSPISEWAPSEVDLRESSTATQLLKQLYSFQCCTDEAHQAHDDEQAQFQFHPREEPCHSFADLLHLQELKPSGPVPDVLSSPTLMEKGPESPKFDPALAQQTLRRSGPYNSTLGMARASASCKPLPAT